MSPGGTVRVKFSFLRRRPRLDHTLGSKSKILKAINTSNSNALTDANSVLAAESLKVNPKDMQLLMKKYGINPKFTNAAKVYKKPVIVQVDEPKVDDHFTESVVTASPY